MIETEAQSQSFLLADQALGLGGHAVRKHAGNYGPLTVHELFSSLTKTFLSAIRAACFPLVTVEIVAVMAEVASSSLVAPAILLNGLQRIRKTSLGASQPKFTGERVAYESDHHRAHPGLKRNWPIRAAVRKCQGRSAGIS